jgi:hypothetical protein
MGPAGVGDGYRDSAGLFAKPTTSSIDHHPGKCGHRIATESAADPPDTLRVRARGIMAPCQVWPSPSAEGRRTELVAARAARLRYLARRGLSLPKDARLTRRTAVEALALGRPSLGSMSALRRRQRRRPARRLIAMGRPGAGLQCQMAIRAARRARRQTWPMAPQQQRHGRKAPASALFPSSIQA